MGKSELLKSELLKSELLKDRGVSEREAEVLALVGDHLTNAQIARRLSISIRTVESHVSSLLRKLDLTDRRGLADLTAPADEMTRVRDDAPAPIRYTKSDGLNIAYQVTGAGDVDLVLVAGFVSHLMLDWTERRHAHLLRRLGTFSRLIRFDKRGTGMSDRPGALPDLETRMSDVGAVMDAARSERAVLFGYSEGGPMSILYAATHPERVRGLVLYSSYARRLWAPDYPWGFRPEERARYAAQLEQDWAWEADMRLMCPNADAELARWWGERCRAATSPGAARALVEMNSLVDVRDVLGAVQAPTLVLHRRHDLDAHVEEGRYLAERIPGARFLELDGTDHFIGVDPDQILDPVEEFVRTLGSPTPTESSLTTLLAVRAQPRIDLAWLRGILQPALDQYSGVPALAEAAYVLATFSGPGRAVRCGLALAERAAASNVSLSVGLHTAEIARSGANVSGAGVAIAQAVADRARAGEVWVTSTLRDLTAGSGLGYERREQLDLPGLDRHLELDLARLEASEQGPAATLREAEPDLASRITKPSLPSPLTSFVGRVTERAALADALTHHRLVTAVGPGGVGKTRLAVAAAGDVVGRYAEGAWYVDLVPVTDPTMVGAVVASTFGFGEQLGRSPTETVISKLAGAEALVVLDNCEHLVDGVVDLVERMLSACPRTTVLATSRARLQVPYERVFTVSGLSRGDGSGEDDAVALFVERAAMAGWSSPYGHDRRRIAVICDELDGNALAIELAAARLATFGLDGLEAGVADRLGLLAGGPRVDDRHRSVRSTLDWSFGLLDEHGKVVLRRASVFTAPFTPAAAATVTGHDPLLPGLVAGALARLADHSLLVVVADPGGTRYRMLETIRQYGAVRMADAGEDIVVRGRHLRWCLTTAARLQADAGNDISAGFDEIADDLRAALGWAAGQPQHRAEAHELAMRLARLAFARGLPSEAQRRFEEASSSAADAAEAAHALHLAAAVAWGRHAGNEAIRLYRAAGRAAIRAGDAQRAAVEFATAAEVIGCAPGVLAELVSADEGNALLAEAVALAGDDDHVQAAVILVSSFGDDRDPASTELVERSVELARRVGDPRLEGSALDQLTAIQLSRSDMAAAAATVRRRLELLTPLADDVEMAWQYPDTLHMAPLVHLTAGDLATARHYARRRRELPFFREAPHLAVTWLLTTAALTGDFDEAVELAEQFRRGWIEAGTPAASGIAFAPAAAAMVHGIRGDDEARHSWLDIVTEMRRAVAPLGGSRPAYLQVFNGLVALHRGEMADAAEQVADAPESFRSWHDGAWRQWYAAVWAEVAVLAQLPDRRERLERARFIVGHNPVASAIVDRAEAADAGDADRLLAAATALDAAGCRYQHARTLVLAGGDARAQGESILAAIGAAPMPAPG